MPYSIEQFLSSKRLPTLPQVALRVIALTQEPEPDVQEIARVVRTDSAIASRILRAANSALFGLRMGVSSVETAIPHLGLTALKSLILGFTLTRIRPKDLGTGCEMQSHWRSALTQAVFAERLAMESSDPDPDSHFLAALLQDVGILCALNVDRENYLSNVWSRSEFPNVVDSELRYYGFSHVDISMELCLRWGLPDSCCEAIAKHHDRQHHPTAPCLGTALRAAGLCAQFVVNSRKSKTMAALVEFVQSHYDWPLERVESVLCDAMIQVHETAAIFSCDIGKVPVERIQFDARQQLAEIRSVDDRRTC